MYHIAWAVNDLDELEAMRQKLAAAGALGGASDHGVNKSLYALDPDGLEFEVTWVVPPHLWGDEEHEAIIRPLDLAGDADRFAPQLEADAAWHDTDATDHVGRRPLRAPRAPHAARRDPRPAARVIDNGELRPGQVLPAERTLCAEFNVARTSVREAIQSLVSLGYLERRGNRAYVVEHLPEVVVPRSTPARRRCASCSRPAGVIEVPMAELAACRATPGQRAEIAASGRALHARHAARRLPPPRPRVPLVDRVARAATSCSSELYGKVLDALFASNAFSSCCTPATTATRSRSSSSAPSASTMRSPSAIADGRPRRASSPRSRTTSTMSGSA